MPKAYEINFDGIVGPTHNYGGLSFGNVASATHALQIANPKEAALQGLKKMRQLSELGVRQALLPPHERPHLPTLRKLGFTGSDSEIITRVSKEDPNLLANCSSASAMWTANAVTISPSSDCEDGRVHFTPANLCYNFHRSIEHLTTQSVFKAIFADEKHFVIHPALPACSSFGDEGAANHTRLCRDYGETGIEFFVYGKQAFQGGKSKPKFFPARQSLEASQAITRLHALKKNQIVFAQQNPIAIDAGVFHNDVISVGNQNVLIYHEQAFFDSQKVVEELRNVFHKMCGIDLCLVSISGHEVTVPEAVQTYLFNSQLVTLPSGKMALIAPQECSDHKVVRKCIEKIVGSSENPIDQVIYLNLKQSMQNGGGPACLRLRVVLNEAEMAASGQGIFLDELKFNVLSTWVNKHYRDRLSVPDLCDPQLLVESRAALDELTQILGLGSVYEFQR